MKLNRTHLCTTYDYPNYIDGPSTALFPKIKFILGNIFYIRFFQKVILNERNHIFDSFVNDGAYVM